MKKQIMVLAAMFVIALVVFVNAPTTSAGNWQDPQLCVSGELLSVIPDADVYVKVPEGTQFTNDVVTCGGDPTQPVIPLGNVTVNSNLHDQMIVTAKNVTPGTQILFTYNGEKEKEKANNNGVAKVVFELP